ncbi:MAG: GldG family protein [Gammaproteobacteria bacterium]|nr:GldG family protein [Gammaproteobacteria bacterium]MDH5800321.1 GldG family protein [Gammaproteobacteria bacterium]
MKITTGTRQQLRIQNAVFIGLVLLLTILLAAVTQRYKFSSDWSKFERNTLSQASQRLLHTLEQPLRFTVFATQSELLRQQREELILKYRRSHTAVEYEFIDPVEQPAIAQSKGINKDGEVIITLGERSEKLSEHHEQAYTNAIQRMARSAERWMIFLSGHGERNPLGKANHDLGEWGKQLQSKGINLQTLNLTTQPIIPVNTAVLVIASPQVDYLPGELDLIRQYLTRGGNLLWLAEPGSLYQLDPLTELLPLEFGTGQLVEPSTQLFGINNPFVALSSEYPAHEITANFNVVTLYPIARPVKGRDERDWDAQTLLRSLPRSWVETTQFSGNVGFDPQTDRKGPVDFGVTLSRIVPGIEPSSSRQQRILVIGDGDFLSNAYLGNGGNSDLGLSMANWLSHDDRFINIGVKTAVGSQLNWSGPTQLIIGFGFLFFIPLALGGTGTWLWLKRRKR